MINRSVTLLTAAALWLGAAAFAAEAPAIARLYDSQVTGAERDIVPLAEAMPADKYNFAPTQGEFKGVRTFAEQVKHLAAVVYMVAAASRSEAPPVDVGAEKGPASARTKEQIVEYLKGAFAYAHKAALALDEKNQLELVKSPFGDGQVTRGGAMAIAAWHSFDHYGQMVVYARMNGVVPPASR
jgi:uncharacterized damage-inducible protein DinB